MSYESPERQLAQAMDQDPVRGLDLELCDPTWREVFENGKIHRKLFYATPRPPFPVFGDEKTFQAVIVHNETSSDEELWSPWYLSTFIAPHPGSLATEQEQQDRFFAPLEKALEPMDLRSIESEIFLRHFVWANPGYEQIDKESASILWRDCGGREVPMKEFYETTDRSRDLRHICVGVTANLARLLWDESLTGGSKEDLKEELRQYGEQLADMGIVESMHVGQHTGINKRLPGVMAEYVAGQLLRYTGFNGKSRTQAKPIMEEFEITPGVLDTDNDLPEPVESYYVDGWAVANAMDFLDCEEEVKKMVKEHSQ